MPEKTTFLKEIATAKLEDFSTQLRDCIPFLEKEIQWLKQQACGQEPLLRQFLEKQIDKREALLARLENAIGQICPKEKK